MDNIDKMFDSLSDETIDKLFNYLSSLGNGLTSDENIAFVIDVNEALENNNRDRCIDIAKKYNLPLDYVLLKYDTWSEDRK